MATGPTEGVVDAVRELIKSHTDGISESDLIAKSGKADQDLVGALQFLIDSGEIHLESSSGSGIFSYIPPHARKEIASVSDLDDQHKLVYQIIREVGRNAIWTKDLKKRANLQQTQMTRILRDLEKRGVVKSCRSFRHKTRKLYIASHLDLAEELGGGPLVTDDSFDSDLIASVAKILVHNLTRLIQEEKGLTLQQSTDLVNASGIINVRLRDVDVTRILRTMVWDGKVEVQNPAAAPEKQIYVLRHAVSAHNNLAYTPCGTCPVSADCVPGGVISPQTCVYMDKWLSF